MKIKTMTIQNLDEDDTEEHRYYRKSNLKVGCHMIYQNLNLKQTNRWVQKVDLSE